MKFTIKEIRISLTNRESYFYFLANDSTENIMDVEESNANIEYTLEEGDIISFLMHQDCNPEDYLSWSDEDGVEIIELEYNGERQ